LCGFRADLLRGRDDASRLHAASSDGLTLDEANPVWLRTPAAPLTAATLERRTIDLAAFRDGFGRLRERFDFVAVEGVGGWMVPITTEYFSNDLAADLRLPVIVVAHNRLGCLNHILLTVRSIQSAGLRCAGVVLNDFAPEADAAFTSNAEILPRCLPLPILPRFDLESDELAASLRQMLPEIGPHL